MNEFNLPPERDMPADVRERVWRGVETGMTGRAPVSGRTRVLAAAAAVVAIAGATAVAASMGTPTRLTPAQPPAATSAAADLSRCHDAAASANHGVASASRWHVVLSSEQGGARTTAFLVDEAAVFCEITATTTTVSRPADGTVPRDPDAPARAVLTTPAGTVAGTLGSDRTGLLLTVTSPSRDSFQGPALLGGGMFLFSSPVAVGGATIDAGDLRPGSETVVLDPAPPPVVATHDAVPGSPSDPADTGADNAATTLAGCVGRAAGFTSSSLPTHAQVGAAARAGADSVVLFRTGDRVDACLSQADRAQVLTGLGTASPRSSPTLLPIAPSLGGHTLYAGLVPSEAQTIEVTAYGSAPTYADVRAGTFAALLPAGASSSVTARVLDASGRTLYDGPLTG